MTHNSDRLGVEHDNLETLLNDINLRKPLSQIDQALLPSVQVRLDGLLDQWWAEVQELDREDWEDMWDYPLQPLVATRDKLIQFKILHRIYYTP